jgi:hypothetical protein
MTDITDELREWVMRNIANSPAPTGSNAKTDASSGNALSKKGGGRALGGGGEKRARATAQQGEEETCEPMGKGKAAEPKPRQLVGMEVTTSNKGTLFRVYRVAPLLAVVVEDEGH